VPSTPFARLVGPDGSRAEPVILNAGIASDALADLVSALDTYFRVPDVENDARWCPDEDPYWRAYVEPEWVERQNGLMVRGDAEVERAATCVFPSVRIVAGLEPRTLLFAEHPVDLEDEPGFSGRSSRPRSNGDAAAM